MAYVAPSPSDFKTRFPQFATVDDARVQIFLTDAGNAIDITWLEKDYSPAIQYLAAHLMTLDDIAGGGDDTGQQAGPISSESFAGMSVSYAKRDQTIAEKSTFGSTSYGRRYYELLIKNKPSIMVVK